jgi:hypothetical protein
MFLSGLKVEAVCSSEPLVLPTDDKITVGMVALLRCKVNVYYQVDERAVIGGKYDTPESYTTTQTENIKRLRVACGECTFTVFCGCCGNILV